MLVIVVVQFIAKTTNSEKTIYFLSLMHCSTNKLKSQMSFKCENFKWKKMEGAHGEGGGGGWLTDWRPLLLLSLQPCYGPMF